MPTELGIGLPFCFRPREWWDAAEHLLQSWLYGFASAKPQKMQILRDTERPLPGSLEVTDLTATEGVDVA